MMRRIVTALLVCALVFSFSAPAFADGDRISVSYYSVDMNQTFFDNTVITTNSRHDNSLRPPFGKRK